MTAQRAFSDWRKEEITSAVFEALKQLKETALEYLEVSAGTDSLQDRYYVGLIAGLNAVLNIRPEDLVEEEEEDNDR